MSMKGNENSDNEKIEHLSEIFCMIPCYVVTDNGITLWAQGQILEAGESEDEETIHFGKIN